MDVTHIYVQKYMHKNGRFEKISLNHLNVDRCDDFGEF